MLTSIIYTCELTGINPFEYLVALQVYKDHIIKPDTATRAMKFNITGTTTIG
ncbi:transposase domain-containing protein [Legionella massiliensis]|uniref:transposase domain-containing protein n=1 Tax=Legionella massiliensis TaxID=1034943 RepID=UPI00159EED83|nr:transposase domain-containing protein [Legionella massiliensis]